MITCVYQMWVIADEEHLLQETTASIVAGFGPTYYRSCVQERRSVSELWDALASRGFLGAHLPEADGGGGRGLADLALVVEETAAGGCPSCPRCTPPASSARSSRATEPPTSAHAG